MTYLVDASVYVFRAWFALPDTLTTPGGAPINAFYGYARFLGDLIERTRGEPLVVAFDESLTTSFRNGIYPAYKANRELPPPELEQQFSWCRALTGALGVTHHASDDYEADDIIATLAVAARAAGRNVCIVTRDKDLAQILRPGDEYWDFAADKRFDYAAIGERFGVPAEALADLQALTGDSVDNIPGVPGIGPKTAAALLRHFGSLETLYEKLDDVPRLPLRGAAQVAARLAKHEEAARVSLRLTALADDVPVDCDPATMWPRAPDMDAVRRLYDELGVGGGLRDQAERLARASGDE